MLSNPGKYLVIDISSVRDEELEAIFVACTKLCDRKGLRVQVKPQVVWFCAGDFKPNEEGLELVQTPTTTRRV